MKKNVLALSIAAMIGGLGFAGGASAAAFVGAAPLTATNATVLEVDQGGVGHTLLVPYFNAQNGNMSVIHVVNTDQVNGKAVKVRFRSAANSDDILDFQVFMSPGDVWTAAVTAAADGTAQIVTGDNTCTVPRLTAGVAQKFVVDRLAPSTSVDRPNQTREGYVEIFNMADIPVNAGATSLYTAIKHVNKVAPCSVAGSAASTLLNSVATTNYTTSATASTAGFDTPSGGLMGDWYVINVPQTTTFSGGATAVVAKVAAGGAVGRGNFAHFPQTETAAGNVDTFTADPLFRTDSLDAAGAAAASTIAAAFYDLPDLSTPFVTAPAATAPKEQAALLTQALAVQSVTNQYANDASITAKTDWVFSMPTRRYSVAANYKAASNSVAAYRVFTDLSAATPAVSWFTAANTAVEASTGNICVNADGMKFYDREETTAGVATPGPVFSPGTPATPSVLRFCGEASVLSFADAAQSVLGGSVARQNLTSGSYENGWAVVTTANGGAGLPILGSSFIKLSNPNVGTGVSGTYGITWPHRFTK